MKLRHIWIVLKKELKDIFRDRKTIFASIIMPMIMFPLLYSFMGYGSKQLLEEGKKEIEIAIKAQGENSLTHYIRQSPQYKIVDVPDTKKAIEDNQIKVAIHIDKAFEEKLKRNEKPEITIEYDDTSQSAQMVAAALKDTLKNFSDEVVAHRLQALNLNTEILSVITIQDKSTAPEKGGTGFMIFSMMLPLFLTMWSAVSGMPAATDLGAGEKERGTLEPLLTTQPKRLSLLMGKFLAVTAAALIGTGASIVGFILSMTMNPEIFGTATGLTAASIAVIILICVSLALIFSAIQLAVSVYARSFKEAQTYLSPMVIIIMIPSYLTMFIDAKAISPVFFHIPLLNAVCIIKEVVAGIFNFAHIGLVLAWSFVYIALAMAFALNMFRKESVIFRV